MKKIWSIRKDEEAVSPVIATILMVAITVVLAAVLYVMVLGIGGPGQITPPIGMSKGSTSTTWTFSISSIGGAGQVLKTDVYVLVKNAAGTITIQSVQLAATLAPGFNYSAASSGTYMSVGDTFTLVKTTYAVGSTMTLLTAGGQGQYGVYTVTG